MASASTKRCEVVAGVASMGSVTARFIRGGRAVAALATGMFCGYWPGWPPLHPVKLAAVVPVHVTTPDAPKVIMFAPELKLAVLATPIVAFGSVSGLPVSDVGPASTYDVPDVTFFSNL